MVPPIRMLIAVAVMMVSVLLAAKADAQVCDVGLCNNVVACSSDCGSAQAASTCRQSSRSVIGYLSQRIVTSLNCTSKLVRQRRDSRRSRRLSCSSSNFCG